jgi:hypothetical protein
MNGEEILRRNIEMAYSKAERFRACGMWPDYIDKQMKAIELMKTNFQKGLALFLDGLQDERDTIRKARIHVTPE